MKRAEFKIFISEESYDENIAENYRHCYIAIAIWEYVVIWEVQYLTIYCTILSINTIYPVICT